MFRLYFMDHVVYLKVSEQGVVCAMIKTFFRTMNLAMVCQLFNQNYNKYFMTHKYRALYKIFHYMKND